MLFTKAVMDGVLSIVFVASLGIGAAFSMFPVGIYQEVSLFLQVW